MDQSSLSHRYFFSVEALTNASRAEQIKAILRKSLEHASGGQKVETDIERRTLTLFSSEPLDIIALKADLQPPGFHLRELKEMSAVSEAACGQDAKTMSVCVEGMTCHSCEVIVERAWKKLDGVHRVDVRAASGKAHITHQGAAPSMTQLQHALGEGKYLVSLNGTGRKTTRPPFWELVGLFALVLILGRILTGLGLFKTSFAVGSGMSLGAIFVVGLVAASSSCIAVSGGLLLSSAAKFNERYGAANAMARMRPVFLFVLGRIAGYALLGGLLGMIGKALAPSPLVTSVIAILAAVYMLVMGLDMLQIAPTWLKRLMPKMPKSLSHRVMDAEGKEHPLLPLGLGAATFFLPCGFTQALQLYALTTGSFVIAALSLGAFALGTAPALLALGWASSSLKGKAGRFFFKFSGALVVVLGLWNIQNGLAIAGYPLAFPKLEFSAPSIAAEPSGGTNPSPIVNGKQVIKMNVTAGYQPNHFTIRAGTPVRWEIDATNGAGCASVLVSRQLGIQKLLETNASNVIEFTPTITGEIPFSCSMGMYRGSFTILPAA
jgi:sulfite exporter TauE/SafE/copper chaperone CopZ